MIERWIMAIRKDDFNDQDKQVSQEVKLLRLTIANQELQQRIASAAQKNNLSPDAYIERLLERTVPKEELLTMQQAIHTVPDDIIEQIQKVRGQVIRDSRGYLFENSAEVLRQQREERVQHLEHLQEQ